MTSNEIITLDLIGKKCPIPLVKTKQLIDNMNAGDSALIFISDVTSKEDIRVFYTTGVLCQFDVRDISESNECIYEITLKKGDYDT